MPKGENVDEMPDDRPNPCGVALGNIAGLVRDVANVVGAVVGGDAAKRGGGDAIE